MTGQSVCPACGAASDAPPGALVDCPYCRAHVQLASTAGAATTLLSCPTCGGSVAGFPGATVRCPHCGSAVTLAGDRNFAGAVQLSVPGLAGASEAEARSLALREVQRRLGMNPSPVAPPRPPPPPAVVSPAGGTSMVGIIVVVALGLLFLAAIGVVVLLPLLWKP